MGKLWEVIGGADKGGILVRRGDVGDAWGLAWAFLELGEKKSEQEQLSSCM